MEEPKIREEKVKEAIQYLLTQLTAEELEEVLSEFCGFCYTYQPDGCYCRRDD